MVSSGQVVKLLKPDGAGHMQRIFAAYAAPSSSSSASASSSSALLWEGFSGMVEDLVGAEAGGVDTQALFEVSPGGAAPRAPFAAQRRARNTRVTVLPGSQIRVSLSLSPVAWAAALARATCAPSPAGHDCPTARRRPLAAPGR